MRDINEYSEKYAIQGFEQYKVLYRRKKILEIIEKYHPKNVLEIGCGLKPLFQYVEDVSFTIVEPALDFYNNAVNLAEKNIRINCIQGFFEDVASRLTDNYDMIVCASLLHEVEKPDGLLKAIVDVCNKNTLVHISVPNANSMHRLLGKEMGILTNVHDMSDNNKEMQQNNVFDQNSLSKIVIDSGLDVIESGAFFVKPFSHAQMYKIMEEGIINEEVLEGLYNITKYMPQFGSEIYVNCKIK